MMKSKYLEFTELDVPERKTKVFEVRNKKEDFFLGCIEWRTGWRKYVYCPTAVAHNLSFDCMDDISAFIKDLMHQRKQVNK